jgi:hypothetical protein
MWLIDMASLDMVILPLPSLDQFSSCIPPDPAPPLPSSALLIPQVGPSSFLFRGLSIKCNQPDPPPPLPIPAPIVLLVCPLSCLSFLGGVLEP